VTIGKPVQNLRQALGLERKANLEYRRNRTALNPKGGIHQETDLGETLDGRLGRRTKYLVLRVFQPEDEGGETGGKPLGRKPETEGVSPGYSLRKRVGAGDSSIGKSRAVVGRPVKRALLVAGGNVGLTGPGDLGTTRREA
jgi:hypothetical protein